jgi:hypothetical protein
MTPEEMVVSGKDRDILRRLGARLAEIAADPVMDELRDLWRRLNALAAERPMILTETFAVAKDGDEMREVIPQECEGEWARVIERALRDKILHFEFVGDDAVVEPRITYETVVESSGYGLEETYEYGQGEHGRGSYVWEPPIRNLAEELPRLSRRSYRVNEEWTARKRELLEHVFDGILPVANRNNFWWTQGMTWTAIKLVGLEPFMLAMHDQPEALHALMVLLRDDHLHTLDWHERHGLLTLNNEDDYVGSGGGAYTDLLPQPDCVPGQPARVKDLWGLSESQETVGVSPAMFGEFIFPYQLPVIARFGLACYGCCEPIDKRWEYVRQIQNLRRVSVSPWSDVAVMAENLGLNYVFSRKPSPALVSADWNEDRILSDLRETITVTKGLNVEIVLKDVHTVRGEPWRFRRWVELARRAIDEVYH